MLRDEIAVGSDSGLRQTRRARGGEICGRRVFARFEVVEAEPVLFAVRKEV